MGTLIKRNDVVLNFFISMFGLKSFKIFLLSITLVMATGFIPSFEKYIYFDFVCLLLFNISMLFDIFSAIMVSKIRGGGFETNKAMKAMAKWIGYNYLLHLSDQLFKFFRDSQTGESIYSGLGNLTSPEFASGVKGVVENYNITPYAIFLFAFTIISFSALKNFQLCDTFRNVPKIDRWIYKNVDIYKNRPTDRLWMLMNDEEKMKIGYNPDDKPFRNVEE